MKKIFFFIMFLLGSCDNEENEKLKNKLFGEPDLSSSHNQIITLYTNNPYDLL